MFHTLAHKHPHILRRIAVMMVVCTVMIAVAGCGTSSSDYAEKEEDKPIVRSWNERPAMAIDPSRNYSALVQTSKGSFEIELFAKEAPETVNNFVFLAKNRYYEGLSFHRIIETFMIQTGDPHGDGTGGPGYTIPDELNSDRKYEPGIVAMAKSLEPDSGGSQFFICTGVDSASLNMKPDYPIFGKVTNGMKVVEAIAKTPVEHQPVTGEYSKPTEVVTIEKISIRES